ncbi:MAG: N-acetylmuramoyl-L-alanine amidase [Bacteroidia bacterium]|jgi:N-acetyl-anhydromuramyl-L-alanine amidase AmpD|nr:N-acetylmuramoyl-L-alanine amidase [Bacteroidia bacterium]
MRKFLLLLAFIMPVVSMRATEDQLPVNPYTAYFNEAYQRYPNLPRGCLEAVAFVNTRFQHLDASVPESCTGMPRAWSVMGLIEDGKGWFRPTLQIVAKTSGYTTEQLKTDPRVAILAYAAALDSIINRDASGHKISQDYCLLNMPFLNEFPQQFSTSEMHIGVDPVEAANRQFVQDIWLYGLYSFVSNQEYALYYGFPVWNLDAASLFGDNLTVLSSTHIQVSRNKAPTGNAGEYKINHTDVNSRGASVPTVLSPDYGPALWTQAASCNFSSRNSVVISAVTIHTVQGSYAGCISWFQNCAAGVSAHYVVRSSDGQVTQMVLEAQKAWHVGTENPYTVGIEHEGYVTNPAWYTTAMYQSSADLTRDICVDNNINPMRTGFWPWLATTYYNQSSIPGNCTRVKGHQHFPNQTHSDPGVNWNWNRYYQLINNTLPAATVYSTATGNFYDSGGQSSNYGDDERLIWRIAPANATSVTLNFTSFAVENTWDYLYIYDGNSTSAPLIGSYTGSNSPGTITSSGGSITLEFRSDCATNGSGWTASWTSTLNTPNADNVAPTTSVAVSGNWQTANFGASFTESDNAGGSGLEKSFYQIIDFDGTDWRANASRGFFSDNFDQTAIHPEWTAVTGIWGINNAVLEQSDENSGNTNIYASLTQNLSNKYLYHWAGKIDGTGNNRRAGFHFFCDSASLTNRGNSYFVWFRVDQSVCEFYEVVNDVFTLRNSVSMTTVAGQWYDWKVIYDRITGKIEVYQNNIYIGSWTDTTPLANGNAVSFRSGNCNWQVNNFKVYRSRFSNQPVTVSVGNCASCELRYQNTNPLTPAGRIKSIVRDSANNLSGIAYQDVNVDWTSPLPVDTVNDGTGADIDLSLSATTLAGNWSLSSDPHSGLASYSYAFGTSPGDSDVVNWTLNWGFDTVALTNLSLVTNQWYYLSVRAENGAGLRSTTTVSDGVLVDLTTGFAVTQGGLALSVYPNPVSAGSMIEIKAETAGNAVIRVTDASGRIVEERQRYLSADVNRFPLQSLLSLEARGVYMISVMCGEKMIVLPVLIGQR